MADSREESEGSEMFGETQCELDPEVRVLLVGETGSGKSASGNTILTNTSFVETCSSESVTTNSQRGYINLNGRTVIVIDTPGVFNTSLTETDVKNEIDKGVELAYPGVHIILIVIKLGQRLDDKNSNINEWFSKIFREEAQYNTMVLFTYGDLLTESIEEHLYRCPKLKKLVDDCNGEYHVFNNKEKNQGQVIELLKKIDYIRMKNKNSIYTIEKKGWFEDFGLLAAGSAAVAAATAAATAAVILIAKNTAS